MFQNYSFSMAYHQTAEMPKTFAEDIECIMRGPSPDAGSLYISNVEAASNPNTLKRFRIAAVLSCAQGHELKHPRSIVPHYRYIPTVDDDSCNIAVHFDEAVAFIESHLKQTNVLVHCIAGVSRSVSMVLAYFIKEHGMHFEEAYHLVKAKRKIIHPNDGFVRQLKQYSQTLKAQQGNARKDASPRAESLSIEKQRGNSRNLDKTMPDFKSVELAPHRETTPQRADRRGELYERYASAQLKSPVYRPPASYSREAAFHSLQHIPDSPLQARESAMTPKAKPAARELEKYELVRTSTNYFTPGRQTLLSQKPYEGRRYEDYARPDTTPLAQTAPPRPAHPLSAARIRLAPEDESPSKLDLTAGRAKPPEEEFSPSRVEFFASKNSELNEKIELIRRKYAAEREKLFSKFQSPQKADPALERRGASLGEFKGPAAARPFDLEERRFGGRAEALRRTGPLESYGQLYSRKYERIASFALNEEESFSSKVEKALRSSPYGTPQRRETDRLGVYPTQFAYPSSNYPSYYKYGSTYKRYY